MAAAAGAQGGGGGAPFSCANAQPTLPPPPRVHGAAPSKAHSFIPHVVMSAGLVDTDHLLEEGLDACLPGGGSGPQGRLGLSVHVCGCPRSSRCPSAWPAHQVRSGKRLLLDEWCLMTFPPPRCGAKGFLSPGPLPLHKVSSQSYWPLALRALPQRGLLRETPLGLGSPGQPMAAGTCGRTSQIRLSQRGSPRWSLRLPHERTRVSSGYLLSLPGHRRRLTVPSPTVLSAPGLQARRASCRWRQRVWHWPSKVRVGQEAGTGELNVRPRGCPLKDEPPHLPHLLRVESGPGVTAVLLTGAEVSERVRGTGPPVGPVP